MKQVLIFVGLGAAIGFLGMNMIVDRLDGFVIVDGEKKTDQSSGVILVTTLAGGLGGWYVSTKV